MLNIEIKFENIIKQCKSQIEIFYSLSLQYKLKHVLEKVKLLESQIELSKNNLYFYFMKAMLSQLAPVL